MILVVNATCACVYVCLSVSPSQQSGAGKIRRAGSKLDKKSCVSKHYLLYHGYTAIGHKGFPGITKINVQSKNYSRITRTAKVKTSASSRQIQ